MLTTEQKTTAEDIERI